MAKKEFQAESKKLMDMMINSIYTCLLYTSPSPRD